jgi:hypothetical protein
MGSYPAAPFDIDSPEFNQFMDVAARFTGFQPCMVDPDDMLLDEELEAAKRSFSYDDVALPTIIAAEEAGLHLLYSLSYFGGSLLSSCNDGIVHGDELYTISTEAKVPVLPNVVPQITEDFVDYWRPRAELFIPALVEASALHGDVLWGWRVLEEPNYVEMQDLLLLDTMRELLSAHDPGRVTFTYTASHAMPDGKILWSLVHPGDDQQFQLAPDDAVARVETNDPMNLVGPFYPRALGVELSPGGDLIPMFDHVASGAYMELFKDLPDVGVEIAETNRIFVYHRTRLGREALDNLAHVYELAGEEPPDHHKLFHAPGLVSPLRGPQGMQFYSPMKAEHARHDLWAGVHEADGIFLYSFPYAIYKPNQMEAAQVVDAWTEYVEALYLIKQEMRPFIVEGTKSHPENEALPVVVVAPEYYVEKIPGGNPLRHYAALPSGYTATNQTLFQIENVGYLVVTNSLLESEELELSFEDRILGVEVVSGMSENLNYMDYTLSDTFSRIDGRVYKITFERDATR